MFSVLGKIKMSEYIPKVGEACEVFPYFHTCIAVCEYEGDLLMHDKHDDEYFKAGNNKFRPIKTQGEIDREEAIVEMAKTVEIVLGSPAYLYKNYCAALYDAGYHNGVKDGDKAERKFMFNELMRTTTINGNHVDAIVTKIYENFDIFKKVAK